SVSLNFTCLSFRNAPLFPFLVSALPLPPTSTLFPYTTLFRSSRRWTRRHPAAVQPICLRFEIGTRRSSSYKDSKVKLFIFVENLKISNMKRSFTFNLSLFVILVCCLTSNPGYGQANKAVYAELGGPGIASFN